MASPPPPAAPSAAAGRQAAYGRTVPSEAFSASGIVAQGRAGDAPAAPAAPVPGDEPELAGVEIWAKLAPAGPAAGSEARYQVQGVLGVGSTGRVYTVLDRNLGRQVAVKVLTDEAREDHESLGSFIAEAKITASLKHPNVLPVIDIDVTRTGQPYFSMGRVDGRTLADLIAESTPGRRHARLASFNGVVGIFIDICDGVAYAHHQRIVHQDIKPENILIGDFGEVLVLDWGCARRRDADAPPAIYGTPLYMSPEQARRETVEERSDIYCIGGTLLHALLLRAPMWHDDPEVFWKRKREGAIDAPSAPERAGVPPELLAIALKALAPERERRYRSIAELRADLEAYQAGLSVSAHRRGAVLALRRWCRRHRRALATWTTVGAAFLALVVLLWGERLKEVARWGTPVLEERFEDDSWRNRWTVIEGGFERREGLVSTGGGASRLLLPRPLSGGTAIEYDAEILPGEREGDISVAWARGIETGADGAITLVRPLGLQIGAYDGAYTMVQQDANALVSSSFQPVPGRRYHIRDEIIDNRLTIAVDGRQVCEYVDSFPLTGGYLALYAYYPGKCFHDVRVYSLGLPQRVAATAIGDYEAQRGKYADGAEAYARVVVAHPGTALGDEARFKEGLCWLRAGDPAKARERWRDLRDPALGRLARLHLLDLRFSAHEHDALLAELAALAGEGDDDLRHQVAMRWSQYVGRLRSAQPLDRALLTRYLDAHDRFLMHEHAADVSTADTLYALSRFEELLARYPALRWQCSSALIELGRQDQVIDDYRDERATRERACFLSGRLDLILRDYPDSLFIPELRIAHGESESLLATATDQPWLPLALLYAGHLEELVARFPQTDWPACRALILLGRPEEVTLSFEIPLALLAQGRYDEVLARYPHDRAADLVHLLQAVEALARGDREAARTELRAGTARAAAVPDIESGFDVRIIGGFLRELSGETGALDALCIRLIGDGSRRGQEMQVPWMEASLMLGRISADTFFAQPMQQIARPHGLLIQALRAERAGRRDEAVARYREWLALPQLRRGFFIIDPLLERFVPWRIAELGR
jgi:hypothetical protein